LLLSTHDAFPILQPVLDGADFFAPSAFWHRRVEACLDDIIEVTSSSNQFSISPTASKAQDQLRVVGIDYMAYRLKSIMTPRKETVSPLPIFTRNGARIRYKVRMKGDLFWCN
jgi:hypothetical protein